jgi:hypothetical protein
MRLNRKDQHGNHIINVRDNKKNIKEERPSSFVDFGDADVEVSDVADNIIRQNQIINRALRRQFRSRISRKAI